MYIIMEHNPYANSQSHLCYVTISLTLIERTDLNFLILFAIQTPLKRWCRTKSVPLLTLHMEMHAILISLIVFRVLTIFNILCLCPYQECLLPTLPSPKDCLRFMRTEIIYKILCSVSGACNMWQVCA